MERFKYIDHPSDIGIEFYGESMEELFENAAAGMFSIINDPGKVDPVIKRSVVISRDKINLEDLLILWLEELLFIFDTENILFSGFTVNSIDLKNQLEAGYAGKQAGSRSGKYVLKANIKGEEADFLKHDIKMGIKAPTYHKLEIIKDGNRLTGRVIFDV